MNASKQCANVGGLAKGLLAKRSGLGGIRSVHGRTGERPAPSYERKQSDLSRRKELFARQTIPSGAGIIRCSNINGESLKETI
jgi:hypothetical protein